MWNGITHAGYATSPAECVNCGGCVREQGMSLDIPIKKKSTYAQVNEDIRKKLRLTA